MPVSVNASSPPPPKKRISSGIPISGLVLSGRYLLPLQRANRAPCWVLVRARLRDIANPILTHTKEVNSQRAEIGEQIGELIGRERVAHRWHHAAALDDRLRDEAVVRGQPAGQEFFPVNSNEPRTFEAARRISRVTARASDVVDLPAARLLRV